jgi:hypothetical protein
MDDLEVFLCATPQGPEKFALILSQEAKKLSSLDRYEQRALFRRKLAIRTLDEALRLASMNAILC